MEDRQRVQLDVRGGKAPLVDERRGVAPQVAVAQHGALGAPGGARGIDDGGEVVRAARRRGVEGRGRRRGCLERAASLGIHRHGLHGPAARVHARLRHEERRLGVAQEVIHLGGRVGGVQGHVHSACLQAAEIERHRLGGLRRLRHHPVPGRHAKPQQSAGGARRLCLQVRIAPIRAAIHAQRRRFGMGTKPRFELGIEVVRHCSFLLSSPVRPLDRHPQRGAGDGQVNPSGCGLAHGAKRLGVSRQLAGM